MIGKSSNFLNEIETLRLIDSYGIMKVEQVGRMVNVHGSEHFNIELQYS